MMNSSDSNSDGSSSSSIESSCSSSECSSDDDYFYCGKRSRSEEYYYHSLYDTIEDDENIGDHHLNTKYKKLKNNVQSSSPTILILDNIGDLNNIKCDCFQLLKTKFAKQQLGKKLWLENRELKYEYIPIEFSKDKQFIMNFIKYHQNKPSLKTEPCWNQISDELKNDFDMILNFGIHYTTNKWSYAMPRTHEHLKIVDNYLNNLQNEDEKIKIIIKIIKNIPYNIRNLNDVEKMFTFTKNIKSNAKLLLEIFKINSNMAQFFTDIDISLQNDRNFIFNSMVANSYIFDNIDPKYYDDKEFIINIIKQLNSHFGIESIFEIISDRLKIDKDIIIECAKKRVDILEYSNKLYENDREFALQLLQCYGKVLKYFSNEIRNDRELVLLAMKNGGNLLDSPEELQMDREIVLESVKHWCNIRECSEIFQSDREIILEAVLSYGGSLEYASEELQNYKEIVLKAVKQSPYSLHYASNELLNDREFIFQIVEQVEQPQLIITNNNDNIISDAIDKFGTRAISTFISTELPKHLCLKLVKTDGLYLKHLSDEMKSDIEIVEQAINQNPISIFYSRLESEKDKKKMISKVMSKINDKYPSSLFQLVEARYFICNLKDLKLAFKLVKYNPLIVHYLGKCHNEYLFRKSSFKAILLENGYWMKFTENHFQERIIHKYYGAKIENNENEINYYRNRKKGELLWNKNYEWKLF